MPRPPALFALLLVTVGVRICSSASSFDVPRRRESSFGEPGREQDGVFPSRLVVDAAGGDPLYKTDRPLIGILSQACLRCPGKSYIAAAFEKWIELAGGRAVPIRFYDSDAELRRLFKAVNGVIFPGGLTDLYLDDPFVVAATKLFTWAVEENAQGNPFPVWGTCLGHQLLQIIVANVSYTDILIQTDAVAQPGTLEFVGNPADSVLFQGMRPDLIQRLADPTKNIVIQNHEFGTPLSSYQRYPILNQTFRVVTTSKDRNGVEYISTIEALDPKFPFFGTQWHPEKPPFEFSLGAIPHTRDAISVSQHLANVFINIARQSSHQPESKEEELAMLIQNLKPVFTARDIVMEPSYDGPDLTYFLDKLPSATGTGQPYDMPLLK